MNGKTEKSAPDNQPKVLALPPGAVDKRRIRIVVADDNLSVLNTIAALFESQFEVVGRASNGDQLLQVVEHHCPEVVVTDLNMPGTNGLDAARGIKDRYPRVKVIVLSLDSDPGLVAAAFEAGAAAFVAKLAAVDELVSVIEQISSNTPRREL